jgi:hypothetical protein
MLKKLITSTIKGVIMSANKEKINRVWKNLIKKISEEQSNSYKHKSSIPKRTSKKL